MQIHDIETFLIIICIDICSWKSSLKMIIIIIYDSIEFLESDEFNDSDSIPLYIEK